MNNEKNIDKSPINSSNRLDLIRSASGCMKAEKRLKRVYAKIQKTYAGDPAFLRELKQRQDAWEKSLEVKYGELIPDEEYRQYLDTHFRYDCWDTQQLIRDRIRELVGLLVKKKEEGE